MKRIDLPRLLAAALSGALLSVISPPLNLHWLHWASFLPLFWALRPGDGLRNALLGYLAGYVGTYSCYYWLGETVVRFSDLPQWIGLAVLHLYALSHALPYALVFGLALPLRRRFGWRWVLLLPALEVATEFAFPALFPYAQGVTQYRVAWVWQLVSITGVYGVSYLLFLVNAVLAEQLYRLREGRRRPDWRPLALAALLLAADLGFGAWRTARVEEALSRARVLRVALMQQAVTMEERLAGTPEEAVQSWFLLSLKLLGQHPELVVWPEGSSPYNPDQPPMVDALRRLVKLGNFDLIIGGGTQELHPDPVHGGYTVTAYNSVYFMDREGRIRGRYDKMMPLPFGEYVPLSDTFPFLKHVVQGPGDFRAGTEATIFQADGYTFAVPICYEAILPRIVRKLKAADLLVNITNDAWFGDTAAPYQHAMLAAVRATEFGRPMLRVAYTGIDMVVEPHGRILYETRPFTEHAEVHPLRLATFDTFYWRYGDVFAWACTLLSLGLLLVLWRREPAGSPPEQSLAAGA